MLRSEHADHLARFYIPPEMLEAASVRSMTDAETREGLGLHWYQSADLGGISFPYLSPITGAQVGNRVRLDHPLPDDGGKYISEPGCRHLFFAPIPKDWLDDTSIPAVFVESEKSALALLALAQRVGRKLVPVALGGCWGWRRQTGKRPLPNGGSASETGPSPDLNLFPWQERSAVLAFDSNASTKPAVRKARRVFAQELAGRGASVLIADVPTEPGVNGPDDLIAVAGDAAMLGVLDSAQLFAECAAAEAKREIADLEADKKRDPLLAIEAVAAVADMAGRDLLIGQLSALKLPGVNKELIKRQVGQYRAEDAAARDAAAKAARSGRLLALNVEGAALLDDVRAFIQRFVILSEAAARVAALWIVHTHTFDAADCTPYLSVTSPEKRSGKTRLIEVTETIVANPWYTGRVTAAVLYRKIDAEAPTLLLDESDAAFSGSEEYSEALRGILNTGHRRGGKATCCVGQGVTISYQDFSTFSPKLIAGIGKLPDTVADRSIPFRLKRKARHEKVERFRLRNVRPEAERLREKLEAWGAQNIEKLRDARPEFPEALSDRQRDGAEALLAIADLAGGDWPEAARRALVSLCCDAQATDDSIGVRLLADIKLLFASSETDKIFSKDICQGLAEIETSPWAEWSNDKAISPGKLARLLSSYSITPGTVRIGPSTAKGYLLEDFSDAWARYLPKDGISPDAADCDFQNVTTLQRSPDAGSEHFQNVTEENHVTDQKAQRPAPNGPCDVVTFSKSPMREGGVPAQGGLTCLRCGKVEQNFSAARYHYLKLCPERGADVRGTR